MLIFNSKGMLCRTLFQTKKLRIQVMPETCPPLANVPSFITKEGIFKMNYDMPPSNKS